MAAMDWEKVLDDFTKVLPAGSPLVFILGAGCSLSSGGPTTFAAFEALDSALSRIAGKARDFAAPQSAAEKRMLLGPKFRDFQPGIGYHLLACLARTRPVYVVNFNWDQGVEVAAHAQGVNCIGFEPGEAAWERVQIEAGDAGLRVIHVHGSLTGNPLARLTETCDFPVPLAKTLDELWAFQKVCAGVDLGYELDFFNFITQREQTAETSAPWYFSRGVSMELGHLDKLRRMESQQHASVTPDFDFDLFMVALAGKLKGDEYAAFAKAYAELPQSLRELCLPGNRALMQMIGAKKLCLAAEPGSGASTLAMLVAFLRTLLAADASGRRLLEGPAMIKAALGNPSVAVQAGTGSALVADGLTSALAVEDREAAALNLCQLSETSPLVGLILVLPLDAVAKLRLEDNGVALKSFDMVLDVRDGRPYTPWELRSLATRLGRSHGFIDLIDRSIVTTIPQVRDERAEALPRNDKPGAFAELNIDADLRRFLLRARLLELSARDTTVQELQRLTEMPLERFEKSVRERYVLTFSFEKTQWFQIAPDKRTLLDELLMDDAPALRKELHGTDVALLFELEQWLLFKAAARGEASDVPGALQPEYFRRLTSTLINERWTIQNLAALLEHPAMDPWGATNVAYALIANWERYETAPRRDALGALLARRDLRGCYAVAEAALFFGRGTAKRVWSSLQTACWELLENDADSLEMSLIVDGFMWRPPIDEPESWGEFLWDFFRRIDRACVQGGALRVFAAYHPDGLASIFPNWEATSQMLSDNLVQAERAAWLIEWHFIHQTMSRAIGFRFGRNDKDLLCRELHELRPGPVDGAQRLLLRGLLNHPSAAGWGFHAAAYLGGKNGWLTDTPEGRGYFDEFLKVSASGDKGVATALVGYQAPRGVPSIRSAVANDRERIKAVQMAAENGAVLEGLVFSQEQFQFVFDSAGLWRFLGIRTPNIEREGLGQGSVPEGFLREVEHSATSIEPGQLPLAAKVVEGLRKGSRAPSLEQAIPARDRTGSVGEHVLQVMLHMACESESARRPEQVQLSLPL